MKFRRLIIVLGSMVAIGIFSAIIELPLWQYLPMMVLVYILGTAYIEGSR